MRSVRPRRGAARGAGLSDPCAILILGGAAAATQIGTLQRTSQASGAVCFAGL